METLSNSELIETNGGSVQSAYESGEGYGAAFREALDNSLLIKVLYDLLWSFTLCLTDNKVCFK